jgi:hypothetical protein
VKNRTTDDPRIETYKELRMDLEEQTPVDPSNRFCSICRKYHSPEKKHERE